MEEEADDADSCGSDDSGDDSDGYLVRWVDHVNIPNISSTLPCLLVATSFPSFYKLPFPISQYSSTVMWCAYSSAIIPGCVSSIKQKEDQATSGIIVRVCRRAAARSNSAVPHSCPNVRDRRDLAPIQACAVIHTRVYPTPPPPLLVLVLQHWYSTTELRKLSTFALQVLQTWTQEYKGNKSQREAVCSSY